MAATAASHVLSGAEASIDRNASGLMADLTGHVMAEVRTGRATWAVRSDVVAGDGGVVDVDRTNGRRLEAVQEMLRRVAVPDPGSAWYHVTTIHRAMLVCEALEPQEAAGDPQWARRLQDYVDQAIGYCPDPPSRTIARLRDLGATDRLVQKCVAMARDQDVIPIGQLDWIHKLTQVAGPVERRSAGWADDDLYRLWLQSLDHRQSRENLSHFIPDLTGWLAMPGTLESTFADKASEEMRAVLWKHVAREGPKTELLEALRRLPRSAEDDAEVRRYWKSADRPTQICLAGLVSDDNEMARRLLPILQAEFGSPAGLQGLRILAERCSPEIYGRLADWVKDLVVPDVISVQLALAHALVRQAPADAASALFTALRALQRLADQSLPLTDAKVEFGTLAIADLAAARRADAGPVLRALLASQTADIWKLWPAVADALVELGHADDAISRLRDILGSTAQDDERRAYAIAALCAVARALLPAAREEAARATVPRTWSPPLQRVVEVLERREQPVFQRPEYHLDVTEALQWAERATADELLTALRGRDLPETPTVDRAAARLMALGRGAEVDAVCRRHIELLLHSNLGDALEWLVLGKSPEEIGVADVLARADTDFSQEVAWHFAQLAQVGKRLSSGTRAEVIQKARFLREHPIVWSTLEPLLASQAPADVLWALQLLAHVPRDPSHDPVLRRVLSTYPNDPTIWVQVARSLSDDADALAMLVAIESKHPTLVDSKSPYPWNQQLRDACEAFCKRPRVGGDPAVLAMVRGWLDHTHPAVVMAAGLTLLQLSPPDRARAVTRLFEALATASEDLPEWINSGEWHQLRIQVVGALAEQQATVAIPLLRSLLAKKKKWADKALWPEVADALVRLGDLEWTAAWLIAQVQQLPEPVDESDRHALKALCALVRAAVPLEPVPEAPPPPWVTDAARIRAYCRGLRRGPLAPARGFLNRGRRKKRGVQPTGDPFVGGSRLVPENQVDARRMDWAATVRLGDRERMMGLVVERQDGATGARPTLIVIDPTIFAFGGGCDRRVVAQCAGTIAQQVLQWGDPVGLFIAGASGERHFIPPGTSANQLERILWTVMTSTTRPTAQAVADQALYGAQPAPAASATAGGLTALLENTVVRRHLCPGMRVYCLADLLAMDPDHLDRLDHSLRARGADWQPIAVRNQLWVTQPIMACGPARWRLSDKEAADFTLSLWDELGDRVAPVFDRIGAAVIDLTRSIDEDIPAATLAALGGDAGPLAELPALVADTVPADGTLTHTLAAVEPPDLIVQMRAAHGQTGSWQGLIFGARLHGWATVFTYAKRVLVQARNLNALTSDMATAVDDALLGLDTASGPTVDDKGRQPVAEPSAISATIGAGVAAAEQMIRDAQRRAAEQRALGERRSSFGWVSGLLDGLRDSVRPVTIDEGAPDPAQSSANSGVDLEMGGTKRRPWGAIKPTPRGRGRYLRSRLGVTARSAVFHPHPAMTPATLAEPATQRHAGKLRGAVPVDPGQLWSVGGTAVTRDGSRIRFGTNEAVSTQPALSAPLATLRAQWPAVFGDELYAALTAAPSLAEIAAVAPTAADAIRRLQRETAEMPLVQALARIQQVISEELGLEYRSYADDPLAQLLRQDLLERERAGTATLLDGLRLTIALQGGKCVEFARLGLIILRRLGIPTALADGWRVDSAGKVAATGHAWAEVMLPRSLEAETGEPRWSGLPLEFSPPYLDGARIDDWLGDLLAALRPATKDQAAAAEGAETDEDRATLTAATDESAAPIEDATTGEAASDSAADETETDAPDDPEAAAPDDPDARAMPTTTCPPLTKGGQGGFPETPPDPIVVRRAQRFAAARRRLIAATEPGPTRALGAVDVALSAASLWSDPTTAEHALLRELVDDPHGVTRFLRFNARPVREEDAVPIAAFLQAQIAHLNLRDPARLDQWLTGVEEYFGPE